MLVMILVLIVFMIAMVLTFLFLGMSCHGFYLRPRGGLKCHVLVQKQYPCRHCQHQLTHGLDVPDHGRTGETTDEDSKKNDPHLFD
jgi:hypothetical protein